MLALLLGRLLYFGATGRVSQFIFTAVLICLSIVTMLVIE